MRSLEICNILESKIPLNSAYSWDNVGLLVGDKKQEIKSILLVVDATDQLIAEAHDLGVDMIIAHHPLIFSPLKKITSDDFIANRVLNLMKQNIALYAIHTNYDIERMAHVVSNKLALLDTNPLELTSDDPVKGLGIVGSLPHAMTVEEIGVYVKEVFKLPGIQLFESYDIKMVKEKKHTKIAVLPGSGKSAIETVIGMGIEVYITGDITHHEGIDAASRGLNILDAGHYGLEYVFVEDMKEQLQELFPDIMIHTEAIKHPFRFL